MATVVNGVVVAKGQRRIDKRLQNLERSIKPVRYLSDIELACKPTGSVFIFDTECYPNFWYAAFKDVETGCFVAFEQSPDAELNAGKLRWMLWRFLIVGFNSRNYDMPMIHLAMKGATNAQLKQASDYIIRENARPFNFEKEYKLKISEYNHIDLIEVAPLEAPLKLYAARLHCQRMQDLPYDPDTVLTREEAAIVRPYCANDLDNTELLFNELKPQLELRIELGKEYQVDLRSKSDAQLAEAVINSELAKLTGVYPRKPTLKEGQVLQYNVPDFISYRSPELCAMLEKVRNARFYLDGLGSPIAPDDIEGLVVHIGGRPYKLGMGGLHSMEKSIAHEAGNGFIIEDNDVESFYPRTILNQRLFPPHLGEAFLEVYDAIVKRRLHAKRMAAECKGRGDWAGEKVWKVIADSLKITINGSFGKLGNKYSTLYAPQLMLQVTITGQLVLLMLIEMLESAGIPCISGNTDGVVSKYHISQRPTARAVIAEWEKITSYKTEETRYAGIYSRDVNNYLATKLKQDKKTGEWLDEIEEFKVKGVFSERGSALNSVLSKNPETLICADAIMKLIQYGTPIHKTITECKDLRRFVSVGRVRGGGEKSGVYLGKVVRWYYPKNEPGYIAYVGSGNKVPLTDGARPLMDMPDEFPNDINYDWYIKETTKMLYGCGVLKKAKTAELF